MITLVFSFFDVILKRYKKGHKRQIYVNLKDYYYFHGQYPGIDGHIPPLTITEAITLIVQKKTAVRLLSSINSLIYHF